MEDRVKQGLVIKKQVRVKRGYTAGAQKLFLYFMRYSALNHNFSGSNILI